ncbi:MAG: primosomal protein N' [Candidatus Schmidhempelia sp.]|nr:primosomal protein N' [Candidatus Schmidhempelia sp.]
MMLIAHVALAVPLSKLFDYLIPESLANQITVGARVKVPFGKRHDIGIVVNIDTDTEFDAIKLKGISEVIDHTSLFPNKLWQLLFWAADYYYYPIGEVLFHALPILLRQGRPAEFTQKTQWQLTAKGKLFNADELSRFPRQRQLFKLLQQNSDNDIIQVESFTRSIYKKLQEKQLIEQIKLPYYPTTWQAETACNNSPLSLNDEQQQVINVIQSLLTRFNICLLDGVTGSGKTEVYLHTLAAILAKGQQALVFVPEIGLTPQTIARFKTRFNAPIDILHSGLNDKERLQVYLRSKNGENAIVIGTRSALFTPFKHLGLIIIDEEHDTSYKQQEGWRYHARDLAIVRAKLENIPIILGSATPSLESLYNVKIGKYQHLTLTKRAGNASFAQQHIIDIKGLPLKAGLSLPLIQRIKKHLDCQQQVLLFLNRRGFAPVLICHDCGWIAECPRCDRPYTYHQQQQKLNCHHCDTPRQIPQQCPKCGSTHLQAIGFGTEQVEHQLKQLFPEIPISRIDRDSTAKKGVLSDYLTQINQGQAHILVGTQILAKGHHFPNVTLVGIIDVDGALFSSDFRATERFAQLYIQVAGRAGREQKSGEVMLQTHHPEHPLLKVLLEQGYQTFAIDTLLERQATLLPPFSHQILIRAADKNNYAAPLFLTHVSDWLKRYTTDPSLWVLGPATANQPKRAGYYRWQLVLQYPNRRKLQSIIKQLGIEIEQWSETNKVRWSIDVDPIEI